MFLLVVQLNLTSLGLSYTIYYEMEKDKTNSKKAFRILKEVTGKRSARTDVINDTEGRALAESVDILKRWEGYCGKVYKNQDGDTDNNCIDQRCEYEREPPP